MSHTPGPWRAEPYADDWAVVASPDVIARVNAGFQERGILGHWNGEIAVLGDQEDAVLSAAAAPDLLVAVENLRRCVLEYVLGDVGRGVLMGAVDEAQAAIAKAKGDA